jgi:hypothetical protein
MIRTSIGEQNDQPARSGRGSTGDTGGYESGALATFGAGIRAMVRKDDDRSARLRRPPRPASGQWVRSPSPSATGSDSARNVAHDEVDRGSLSKFRIGSKYQIDSNRRIAKNRYIPRASNRGPVAPNWTWGLSALGARNWHGGSSILSR